MKLKRLFLSVLAVATLVSTAALADDFDKKTVFTVDQTFVVPGAHYTHRATSVPAGTYVIKFQDPMGTQNVAYLYDQTEQHLIATALPVPISFRDGHYADPAYDQLIQFEDGRKEGEPARLVRWFYPGYSQGWGFVD